MATFCKRVAAFALVATLSLAVFLALAWVLLPRDPQSYYVGFDRKLELLEHQPAGKPRIIVAGGSNAAFGVDSELIAAQCGAEVVNSAIHAGIGLPFMLHSLEPHLRQGDLVVVSPEYQHFTKDRLSGHVGLGQLLHQCPGGFAYVKADLLPGIAMSCYRAVKSRFEGFPGSLLPSKKPHKIYSVHAWNEYGDSVSHLGRAYDGPPVPPMWKQAPPLNWANVRPLRSFVHRSRQNGADVVLLPPCIRQSDWDRWQEVYRKIWHGLAERLGRDAVLATPSMFVYPDGQFYDTAYHLKAEGRRARTNDIVAAIRGRVPGRVQAPDHSPAPAGAD
jgi:hypothetical protein